MQKHKNPYTSKERALNPYKSAAPYLVLVWVTFSVFFQTSATLRAEVRLTVRHEHALKNCTGELVFTDQGVDYLTKNEKHGRSWTYTDIQQLGLMDSKNISILTYEDSKLEMGKDRRFHFVVTAGSIPNSLWTFLQSHLTRPLVVGVLPATLQSKYEIPVKHLHAWGGCQGVLRIGEDYVSYETSDKEDSRLWRYDAISSLGSTGPFQLRLTTMERTGSEISGEKNFIFDLKQRLEPKVYDFLWWKVNGPQIHAQNHN
jgi:hypothetical protein